MTDADALEKMRDAVRLRHFSLATEKAYCHWVQSYMHAIKQFPQKFTSEQKIQKFLTVNGTSALHARLLSMTRSKMKWQKPNVSPGDAGLADPVANF